MTATRTYAYRARDTRGELVTGSMVADSADEVGARLRGEGKYVLSVSDHALTAADQLRPGDIIRGESAKRVRRDDVIAFAQQMGVMLETGVPLDEALEAFRQQLRNEDFRTVLDAIHQEIRDGESFSASLSRWPRVFPNVMVSLMKASEASGTMATMLGRVGMYLGRERRTARQIKGALAYPMFMMIVGLGITIFLLSFVLPRFARIYEQRSAALPLPTRILMGASDFLISNYLIYGPVLLALLLAFLLWRSRPSGRRVLDWLRLHVPILRTLYGQLYITRATRTMSTLMSAGVNLLDIIDICRGVTRNYHWDRLWDAIDRQVRNGHQLSTAVSDSGIIPPNVASMIAAGEKAGRLSEVMGRIAEFSDEELEMAVKQTTTLIEPIMICLMGFVVGGVAIALLLPIFTLSSVLAN